MVRPDSPHIPDEYLREIGQIAVSWNRLESVLQDCLVFALMDSYLSDGRATAVFVHMAFPQKLDALGSMLRILDENLATLYREQVQGLLKQAQEKRNSILHQRWFSYKDGVKRYEIKARGELKQTVFPVSLEELRDISDFIEDAYLKMYSVLIQLWGRIRPPVT